MVFLDVVYNHFGPDGNYLAGLRPGVLPPRAPHALGRRHRLRDAGRCAGSSSTTRLYWLDEFRFDGLRFDAVDHVHDPDSDEELLVEIARDRPRRLPRPARPPDHRGRPQRHPPARTRPRRRGRCSTPPNGTTTSTTSPTSSPPARPKVTTSTSPTAAGRTSPARWPRASPTRASRRPCRRRPAACRAATCRPPPSSTSCRTTTRSATAPSASGCWRSRPSRWSGR